MLFCITKVRFKSGDSLYSQYVVLSEARLGVNVSLSVYFLPYSKRSMSILSISVVVVGSIPAWNPVFAKSLMRSKRRSYGGFPTCLSLSFYK